MARDVDGSVLHYSDAKSRKRCKVAVPMPLAGYLANLASTRAPDAPLFDVDRTVFRPTGGRGAHTQEYPRAVARKFCALAGVTPITCQQMRATHDKLGALDLAHVTGERHSVKVAIQSYIGRDVVRQAQIDALAARLGRETPEVLPDASEAALTVQDEKGMTGV